MYQWGFLGICIFSLSSFTIAVKSGNSISFSEAKELILSSHGGLSAARIEIEAAKEGISQAGVLPNPGVNVLLDNFGNHEMEASLGQSFEFGGKRKFRSEMARKEFDAAVNASKMIQIEVESEMIRRFVPITITESKLSLLDSLIAISSRNKKQIELRVNSGASKKTDLIRAEIEVEQYTQQRNEYIRQIKQARQKFASLGGRNEDKLLNIKAALITQVQIPALEKLQKAILASPEVAAYDIEYSRLLSREKILKSDAVPDLNISAGVLTNTIENKYSPLLGMSMNIPIFNRNIAALKQTTLQKKATLAKKENAAEFLMTEINDIYSRIMTIEQQMSTLSSSTIPKAEQAYSMLQEYYNSGSTGYLDMTEMRTEMLSLQLQLLELQSERFVALADIMQKTTLKIQLVR